jgi:NAD(P)-dependent dehydrogenase (short-subunit alcohol dehydrogenase family)
MTLCFTPSMVDCFAAASQDYSPLHMSDAYSRATPYGERVVHGTCVVLASCGFFTPQPGLAPSAVRAVFYHPVFLNVAYELDIRQPSPLTWCVVVKDGLTKVMEATFEFRPGIPVTSEGTTLLHAPASLRTVARVVNEEDLEAGWSNEGAFYPDQAKYLELLSILGVRRKEWGDALPFGLMGSSYLTGMEMPGERALYFRLQAEFPEGNCHPGTFHQELREYDARWGLAKSHFRFSGSDGVWCRGEMHAFLRPPPAVLAPFAGAISPEIEERFRGKIALVVGASRGFGSALALTLAAAGATVIALYSRSSDAAERLKQAAADLPGRIVLIQGDATDPDACRTVREKILESHGRLDWLVCSGSGVLQPLRVEPSAFDRMRNFIQSGFALTLAPLVSFLDLLSDSEGVVLFISSSAVENPPASWPHYVALKCALEGLLRAAAADYQKVSFCIARPSKLKTDLVNTPMGRANAEDPAIAALRVLSQAARDARPGHLSYSK